MALSANLLQVTELEPADLQAMHRLLDSHFANATWESFQADLREKTWAILLREEGRLAGFSTALLMETAFEGETFQVVFSGDTIVDPAHWGSPALQTAFTGLLENIRRNRPGMRLFWFLISKGFRTYRLLPLYFRDFHPRYDSPMPPWHRRFLDHLAAARYPGAYRPERGILAFAGQSQCLRPHLAEIPAHKLARDPHVRFFAETNAGWPRGEELACLAEYTPGNLTPHVLRRLRQGEPGADRLSHIG